MLIFPIGSAKAEPCKTNQKNSVLCKGDKAWFSGYLVKSKTLEELIEKEKLVPELQKQRDGFRDLVDEYKKQRDDYQAYAKQLQELLQLSTILREDYTNQRDKFEDELTIVEEKYEQSLKENAKLEASFADAWAPWEVALLTVGVGILAVGSGVGIGYIAGALK